MKMKKYVLQGDPVPLARPRFSKITKRVFDPQKSHKLYATIQLDRQHDNDDMFVGPIHIDITFYMSAPAGISQKRKLLLEGKYHTFRPDLDNLEKMLLDLLSGVAYKEDCIVSKITSRKVYDTNPRTEFIIKQLPDRANISQS